MCYDRNNESVIIYFYIIIMSLATWSINMPVITSLLLVNTVMMDHYNGIITFYDSNNGPIMIITVIMDLLGAWALEKLLCLAQIQNQ